MIKKIYRETVSQHLWEILNELMIFDEFSSFRLVGGTALSLQLGHRISVDIDLFSDEAYGSIDFRHIDNKLQQSFPFVDMLFEGNESFGKSYIIGMNVDSLIKLDAFYTDKFVRPTNYFGEVRFADLQDIAAMKFEVVGHKGRKKDFWDIHELLDYFTLDELLGFHAERYPSTYTREELILKMTDFSFADSDFDPICLKGKYWELIKLDLFEEASKVE